jgi:large subunit ribosomal protein L15
MKLNDLKPTPGSTRRKTRVGRGIAAGKGKTAGRGTKGQGARGRRGKRAYFEGGQLPLVRRLPFKRGFTNVFRVEYQEVNVEALNERFEAGSTVTPQGLVAKGLLRDAGTPIVILGRGEIDKALTVQGHRISKGAQEKLQKAGGTFEKLELAMSGLQRNLRRPRKEDVPQATGDAAASS